jgi:hypothetical protein
MTAKTARYRAQQEAAEVEAETFDRESLFQQDGATAHSTRHIANVFNETVISQTYLFKF